MRTAPLWISSTGYCISGGARFLVLALTAVAASGCVPEHGEEDYAMSAVTKSRRADKTWAAKVVALPDRALLAPARPPGCGSYATAGADSDTSQRSEGHASASHQPASSGNTDAHGSSAGTESPTTASAATPPANPTGARDHANSDLEARIALEYERACYKRAEARVRARLNKLQLSVSDTIKAVERRTENESQVRR